MRFKIVHLKKPEVVSVHDSKEKAEHALAVKMVKFRMVNKKDPFLYGVVPSRAIFKNTRCMGGIWT